MNIITEIIRDGVDSLVHNENALGEILRAWAFVGGYGCYSTFDLREGFEPIPSDRKHFEYLMGREYDETGSEDSGWVDDDAYVMKEMQWYRHTNGIEVGWYWDGDGILCFFVPELEDDDYNGTISNGDCKKSSGWEFGYKY